MVCVCVCVCGVFACVVCVWCECVCVFVCVCVHAGLKHGKHSPKHLISLFIYLWLIISLVVVGQLHLLSKLLVSGKGHQLQNVVMA